MAASVAGPHGTLELITENDSVRPGQAFWAGLHFVLERGWHIYWVNPGDSGEPPMVQWNLPAGLQAGPIEWPTPKRLETASITDYGYEDDVLLLVPMHVPAGLKAPGTMELTAKVKWLVCKDICLPGKASVSLSVPVRSGGARSSEWRGLFEAARQELPKPPPSDWKITAASAEHDFVLTIETGARVTTASFFPLQAQQIENAAPQRPSPFARGVRLRLKKSDQLLKPISRLQGVVVCPGPHSYMIDAPVVQSSGDEAGRSRDSAR